MNMVKGNGAVKVKPSTAIFTPEELRIIKPVLDRKTTIVEMPVSQLEIDYGYQERDRHRMLGRITDNFIEALLGVLSVSRRPDGSHFVVNGATRKLAIEARGEKERVVRVELFLTDQNYARQEPLLFRWLNSKESHEPIKLANRLHSDWKAGTDHGFGDLIHKCDFVFVGNSARVLNGPGYAVQAWHLDNGEVLERTLFALKSIWREKHKHKIKGVFVFGIALLYYAFRTRSIDEQVRRLLDRKSPDDISELVVRRYLKAGGRARIHPDEMPKYICAVMATEINKNPGKSGKLDLNKLRSDDLRPGA